ncbi:MAG: homoserine O-acetyltransferase/O-succinyltransferase family protein, partial [Terriglobia bacterium]
MPLMIEGGRIPNLWAGRQRVTWVSGNDNAGEESIRIALINNMPDPALEDTEIQFCELLDAAAGGIPVRLKLYSLPGIPRSTRGQERLRSFYHDLADLLSGPVDAVIMTGTEPHHADLREEPYWRALAGVLDWAERNTISTILSCLAAHAGVLYSDGIARHALGDKRFGVFECKKTHDHALTVGAGDPMRFPHSRWNEVREADLILCGYAILTESAQAGVDLFAKRQGESLFVYLQGHPEYGARTLLKEYRRDVRRFLNHERETYPSMPEGYFDADAAKLLADFRENA